MNDARMMMVPVSLASLLAVGCIVAAGDYAADGGTDTANDTSGAEQSSNGGDGDGDGGGDSDSNDDSESESDGDSESDGAGDGDGDGDGDDDSGSNGRIACIDGRTIRFVNPPRPNDLIITELMPNPFYYLDETAEWFEIHAFANVDLNGLQIGEFDGSAGLSVEETIEEIECLSVLAGSTFVIARNDVWTLDPIVTVSKVYLNNTPSSLAIGWGGALLDWVEWTVDAPDEESYCRTSLDLDTPVWTWSGNASPNLVNVDCW